MINIDRPETGLMIPHDTLGVKNFNIISPLFSSTFDLKKKHVLKAKVTIKLELKVPIIEYRADRSQNPKPATL